MLKVYFVLLNIAEIAYYLTFHKEDTEFRQVFYNNL